MIRLFNVFIPARILALLAIEAAIMELCYVIAVFVAAKLFVNAPGADYFLFSDHGFWRIGISVVVTILVLYFHDLYDDARKRSSLELAQHMLVALGVSFLSQAFLAYLSGGLIVPRYTMILGSILIFLVFPVWRIMFALYVTRGIHPESVVFVGTSPTLLEISARVRAMADLGMRVVGFYDDNAGGPDPLPGITRLGTLQNLQECLSLKPHRIVVGLSERREKLPIAELMQLRFSGVQIEQAADTYETVYGRISTREFRASQFIFMQLRPLSVLAQSVYCAILALVGLIILAPVMLLVALAVRLTSRGPALYKQQRVGLNGRLFYVYKFRSMYVDAESRTGAVWATRNDPRITPLGRFLRKARLDELPQLVNVLNGDMAIAGPRPERPEFVEQLSEQLPYFRQRHCVKPGITGWAQINYKYGDTVEDTRIKLEYDFYYIKHMSPSLDAYIFFHTIKTMLLSRGAQ